jgi:hypothetical protein
MKSFIVGFICVLLLISCNNNGTNPTSNESVNGNFVGKTDKSKDVNLTITNNVVTGYIYVVMAPTAAGAGNVTLKATVNGTISGNIFSLPIIGDGMTTESFLSGKIENNTITGEYFAAGIIFTFDIWGNFVSSAAVSSGSKWSAQKK